jgi:hypothetical protein
MNLLMALTIVGDEEAFLIREVSAGARGGIHDRLLAPISDASQAWRGVRDCVRPERAMMPSTQGRRMIYIPGMSDRLEARILLATIPIFSTGVGNDGMPLAGGATDPHFKLISSPNGAQQAFVFNSIPSTYVPNSATSQWIGPAPNPFDVTNSGDYTYRETFDLSGLDPSAAVIQGQLASDNDSKLILNGVDTGVALTEGDVTSPRAIAP